MVNLLPEFKAMTSTEKKQQANSRTALYWWVQNIIKASGGCFLQLATGEQVQAAANQDNNADASGGQPGLGHCNKPGSN